MEVEDEEEVGLSPAITLTLRGYKIKGEGPGKEERQEDKEEKQADKQELLRVSLEFG